MHRPVLFLFILLQIWLPCTLVGQQFENIYLGTEASVISCFLQDSEGMIWIGSNKGLFSYDGYSSQPHFTFGERSNTRIYCGTVVDSTYLYIGADNGLLIYNYRTDTYQEPEADFPTDIRTLALRDGVLKDFRTRPFIPLSAPRTITSTLVRTTVVAATSPPPDALKP